MSRQKLTLKEEKKIVSECKKNLKRFSALYENYVDDVYRYTFMSLKNSHEAEDVTSQTFSNAIEKIKDFEWRGVSVKSWFFKIARNLIYRKFRRPQLLRFEEKIEVEDLSDIRVEEIVVDKQLKKKLRELVLRLDDTTREIIALRIWDEYKFSEISKLLEINEATVKTKFYRGVVRLKQMLADEEQMKADFVLILGGVGSLKTVSEFLPSGDFKARLESEILGKARPALKATKQATAVGAQSLKGIILTGVTGLVVIGTIATGFYFRTKNQEDEDKQGEQEEENNEEKETVEDEASEISGQEESYEGWLTYNSEQFGLWFKYPPSFSVTEGGGHILIERTREGTHSLYRIHFYEGDAEKHVNDLATTVYVENKEARGIYEVGEDSYQVREFESAEGVASFENPELMDSTEWILKYVRINDDLYIDIELQYEKLIDTKTDEVVSTEQPSGDDIKHGELLLKSVEFWESEWQEYKMSDLDLSIRLPPNWQFEDFVIRYSEDAEYKIGDDTREIFIMSHEAGTGTCELADLYPETFDCIEHKYTFSLNNQEITCYAATEVEKGKYDPNKPYDIFHCTFKPGKDSKWEDAYIFSDSLSKSDLESGEIRRLLGSIEEMT